MMVEPFAEMTLMLVIAAVAGAVVVSGPVFQSVFQSGFHSWPAPRFPN
ncbi:hypothetical protein Thiowin_02649 [Thiorhodovibrio winogradskyi]|uniref:Uncharacterized protein n=1 Tax=Thiorhodovibrio winogradskyi TaxID=77007 RepID=A0ABZ0SBF8_9GAMM